MESQPISVTLDRKRQVRWTERAQARNSSLPRPATFTMLAKGRNRLYAMCAILWSALVDRSHDFEEPEDLAVYLKTEEQQLAAFKAITEMIDEAFPQKKSECRATSLAESETTSPSGPPPSSNAEPAAATGGTCSPASPPPSNSRAPAKRNAKLASEPTS